MTYTKLSIFSLLQWIFLALLKLAFFKGLIFGGAFGNVLYWALTAVIVTAFVRRLGVINFLEAILVCFLWTVGNLLLDLLFVFHFTGSGMYKTWAYWIGLAVVLFFVFFFHKKRHVEIRHEHAAHGHH